MPREWVGSCKDCGEEFVYSDYVHQQRLKKGLSAPERCRKHREQHGKETRSIASSHFGLIPRDRSSILGTRFLGSLDHGDRGRPVLGPEVEPKPDRLKVGLKDEHVQEIYGSLERYRVLVIVAPTGAGKSTIIPCCLLSPLPSSGLPYDHFTRNGPIIITQPRRAATGGIPGTIAKYCFGSRVGPGSEIGYRHGKERERMDPWNRLVFVTDGTLVNWLADHRANDFSIIIIDEAHERSTQIDLILGMMRNELQRHPHLKLIILSATIHADTFTNFFEDVLPGQVWHRDFEECKKSFGYKVEWWTEQPLSDAEMTDAVATKVVNLLKTTKSGGILGFLPGEGEIKAALKKIEEKLVQEEPSILRRSLLLPLYAILPQDEIDRATEDVPPKTINQETFTPRRVVIATNIAETSLTIPDVVYVVDSGLIKESVWDSKTCTARLESGWHSQDGCKQRWGRAGRVQAGFVFTLYRQDQFDQFSEHTEPAVQRECLDAVLLRAKRAGIADLDSFPWIEPPNRDELKRVKSVFTSRELVDGDGDFTERGAEIYDLYQRISPLIEDMSGSAARALDVASLLLLSDRYGCLLEAASVVALMDRMGDALYFNDKGLFLFDKNWPLKKIDEAARIHRSLRAGCLDDLDFALKVMALYDRTIDEHGGLGGEKWVEHAYVNVDSFQAGEISLRGSTILEQREAIIEKFKGRDGEVDRMLDLGLASRLRLLFAAAWPDRAVTVNGGTEWISESGKDRGVVSIHSAASAWTGDVDAILAATSPRKQTTVEGRSPHLLVANFLVLRPPGVENLSGMFGLARSVHEHRRLVDRLSIHARLLADQFIPVGETVKVGENGKVLFHLPGGGGQQVEYPTEKSESDGKEPVLEWTTRDEGRPTVVLDHPSRPHATPPSPGTRVKVDLVRPVPFTPTGKTMGFVGRYDGDHIVYLKAEDLSIDPRNPGLDELQGKSVDLDVVAVRADGSPVLSLLLEAEASREKLLKKGRLSGTLANIYRRKVGEAVAMTIVVPDPDHSWLTHAMTCPFPTKSEHFSDLKEGCKMFFNVTPRRWGENENGWSRNIPEETKIKEAEQKRLSKSKIRIEGNQIISREVVGADEMYTLTLAIPDVAEEIRSVYGKSQGFYLDLSSLDTAQSLAAKVQKQREKIEKQHAEIAKLNKWVATAYSEEKKNLYQRFLQEAQMKLAVLEKTLNEWRQEADALEKDAGVGCE